MEAIRNYVLITNSPVTSSQRTELADLLNQVIPTCTAHIWGGNDVCAMLDNAPNIRIAFPQILGLRDLKELLASVVEKPILERSTLSLERAGELAQIFVPTQSYSETLATLSKHCFGVLTGPPEMGKTTIARVVGLGKLGENWECFECRKPDDFFQVLRKDRNQIFIADDAFGSTEYRPDIAHAWAADLDSILRALDSTHWFLWTSRPAPLNLALERMHLQGAAEHFPKIAEVIVEAAKLSPSEKVLILYRHAKAAKLESCAKQIVIKHARSIVQDEHFTPERIRRFINQSLSSIMARPENKASNDELIATAVQRELREPTKAMKQSFEALEQGHQRFLIAMLDAGEAPVNKDAVHQAFLRHSLDLPSSSPAHVAQDLNAHFIRESDQYDWMHPSWRDLVIDYLANSPKVRLDFLKRCGIDGIQLALSGAGGAEGERTRPLLVSDEDWQSLQQAIQVQINNEQDAAVHGILSSLLEALLQEEYSTGDPINITVKSLLVMAANATTLARKRWDHSHAPIELETIEVYRQLSELLDPLPPMPQLIPTWKEYWEHAGSELSFDPTQGEVSTYYITKWTDLVTCIQRAEPRLLMQIKFPDSCLEEITTFFEAVDTFVESEDHYYSKRAYDEEIEALSELKIIVKRLGDLMESEKQNALLLGDKIETKRARLETEVEQEYPEPPYEKPDYKPSGGGIGIEEILSDL
jgi:hypothetical protein